ncbi:MAG: hypothetical protein IIB77_00220, partial [Proteobacteria bacterium]|nr:hypothetical protein [Pseudomonadota bacterium]
MPNRDDQEGDAEKSETGGNELELPDLDEADFESTPSVASSPETDIPIDVDATELNEVDADIIDISDEEVQQEFEQMDKEEQEAGNPAVTLSSAETAELKTAGPIQQDSPNFDVPEAARDSSVDSKKDAAASANTSLDSEDHATSTGLVANYFRNLSPKLFYGSVSAVVLTAAVLWFVSIGTEQPSVAAEQALLEAETRAEQNAIFVDAG